MPKDMQLKKQIRPVVVLWLALSPLAATVAQRGGSDARAEALAQKVMQRMGGESAWASTRYLAWTFNDQYQLWDKHRNRFRWEMEDFVVILNTKTKDGKAYKGGQEIQDEAEKRKLLERVYALYIYNTYWLVMPFKLQDPGVALRYIGAGNTMDGSEADVLEMTFGEVGLTPQNRYRVWVDRGQGLVTQWAFYLNASDTEPIFTRRWANYQRYGKIKLASDRSNPQSDFELFHIASPPSVPERVFNSPTPIKKF